MANKSVQALLDDIRLLGADQYFLVEATRSLVTKTVPRASEEVKYGGILFSSGGVPFCGVFAYTQHVSVEFGSGAKIVDALGHLEGAGKGRRHIKLRTAGDIQGKCLGDYLRLALEASTREA